MENNDVCVEVVWVVIIVCCVFWVRYGGEFVKGYVFFVSLPWFEFGLVVFLMVFVFFIVWFSIKLFRYYGRKRQRIKEVRNVRRNYLHSLFTEDFGSCGSSGVSLRFDEIRREMKNLSPNEFVEFKGDIEALRKRVPLVIREKLHDEALEAERKRDFEEKKRLEDERRRLEEERKNEIFKSDVSELFDFMKKKNSHKALPLDRIYSSSVINEASWLMEQYLENKQWEQWVYEEATEFYNNHDFDCKPILKDKQEQEIYEKRRSDAKKEGSEKNNNIPINGLKLNRVFYRTSELSKEKKLRAKLQGFEYIRCNELDGRLQGGFYIKNKESNETPYHFCMKHLFAELHDNMKIEHSVKGRRTDVALLIDDFKLGIEIETGKNLHKFSDKLSWLNTNFNQWIIVCKKELLSRYIGFVDNKNSFCFTPKEAKEYIENTVI